ncbi:MAG TPA: helical backbone metal receptor [Pseudonocardia sp.]|uniref:helical backbone metal receptor n=1 Tax=Pseudonocardia sp. TaxID=60912 RepID=UPI002C031D89|nr:helical backbone metal receptor [Pseudonocardia sp.]HTF55122.1 helical backbone metal receptor [Pseudonocardia sp.]
MSPALLDDLGEPVELAAAPSRVVSLVPSVTEAVAVSVPGVLVGATDYCIHPAELDVARVGGSKYPKLPAVRAARPDLVLANAEENRAEDVAALRADGIPVWVTEAAPTVPAALASIRRLLAEVFHADPEWLALAEGEWGRPVPPVWATAIVPVWRRPWVLLGRDTFAGDVLRRLGVANAYAEHADRYPRPPLDELRALLAAGRADLVVLPDEPYLFTPDDGPEAFPGARCAFLDGRLLTWCGPSLAGARPVLTRQLEEALDG